MVLTLGLALSTNFSNDVFGQTSGEEKEEKAANAEDEEGDKNTNGKIRDLSKVISRCTKHEGLFTIYQDTLNGSLYLQIEAEKLGKEFIYFGYAENGIPFLNMFKGAYRETTIFKPIRYFNRIEFQVPNYNFYFDPENPHQQSCRCKYK